MELSKYQNSLLFMLKTMLKNNEITEDEIVCIFLTLKTDAETKEMVDYMLKNPNITSSEILTKAIKIHSK